MRVLLTIVGVVLFVVAAGTGLAGIRNGLLWTVLRRVESTTPDLLIAAARAGTLGSGMRAITGTAGAGRAGLIVSAVNGEPCVWHRHTIRHRDSGSSPDSRGNRRRTSGSKRVADVASREPFALKANGVGIEVRPDNMRVDRPLRRGTRTLPGLVSKPFPDGTAEGVSAPGTYHHEEWIIRAGVPLYVLGEVIARPPHVMVRRPAKGPHLISTRDTVGLIRRTAIATIAYSTVAVLGLIAAVRALIVGLV